MSQRVGAFRRAGRRVAPSLRHGAILAAGMGLVWSATLARGADATPPIEAQPLPAAGDARRVFDHFAESVMKVRLIERTSGAQATIGSGFWAGAGRIVTNYHVVSKAVHDPDLFRIEGHGEDGSLGDLELLAIDVVRDLAVLGASREGVRPLAISETRPMQGTRLYSLGYPHDLGRTIIEGTYNGLLQNRLLDKIHFSGSINPGMSGGPTIDEGGAVVGVNVQTAGDQVGFLVPAEPVRELLEQTRSAGFEPPADFRPTLRAQLWQHQDETVDALVEGPVATETFGAFVLAAQIAPFLKCWGDAEAEKKAPFSLVSYQCSAEDFVYVEDGHWGGMINYQHHLIESRALNPFRFHALYTHHFATPYNRTYDDIERFTDYECESSLVDASGGRMKVAFCLRALREFDGLYDFFLKIALLGRHDVGVESALSMSNVSFDNARRVTERFIEATSWKR